MGHEATFRIRVALEPDDESAAKSEKDNPRSELAGTVIKSNEEQRYVLMVAYAAMKKDVGVAQDGFTDFGQPSVVEKACHQFMRKGCKLGMWHKEGYDPGEVVENYIYRGPTWIIKGDDGTTQTIEPGDWLCGMILKPEVFEMYKAGWISGASPQGKAKRRIPDQQTLAQLRS